jgi:branched-chain amino acid transport system ATP-binding protein
MHEKAVVASPPSPYVHYSEKQVNKLAILETKNVCKYFGGLKANENVSIKVEKGDIYGLIGPNGAGKTTFMNCISGSAPPTSGQVIFDGEDVTGKSAPYMCHKGLARTYQIVRSFSNMSVLENVLVGGMFGAGLSREEATENALKYLKFVDFPLSVDVPAHSLNTIQLKKVEMARALNCNCKLILLDEVAAGLTPGELNDITQLILRMRDEMGISVIIIEHLMKLIMDVCNYITVLYFGEMLSSGTPDEIAHDDKVIKAYLGEDYIL